MTYDYLDRLLSATSPSFGGNGTHAFTYDPLDNLRSWTRGAGGGDPGKDYAAYQYDANHRLTGILGSASQVRHTFTWDAQGNLSSRDGTPWSFDYGNRNRGRGGQEGLRYDGHGRRVSTWLPSLGQARFYMYTNSGQLLFAGNGTAQVNSEHIYLGGSLVASVEYVYATGITQVRYKHTDALGSPVVTTDASGNQVGPYVVYEPYGKSANTTIDGIGYTGHVMDPQSDLVYMQQRYYDPVVGRFLSVDPIGSDTINAWNFNRYNYAANNPYVFTDPDGRIVRSQIQEWGRKEDRFPHRKSSFELNQTEGTEGSEDSQERKLEADGYPSNDGAGGSNSLTRFWRLSAPSESGGHIVQKVTTVSTLTYAQGASVSRTTTQWEAWSVDPGASGPTPSATDVFKIRWVGSDVVRARVDITASARFYEGLTTLPSTFRVGGAEGSGMLPSTYVDPRLSTDGATDPVVIQYTLEWP